MPVDLDYKLLKLRGLQYAKDLFEDAHEKTFTYRLSADAEFINLRIVAEEVRPDLPIKKLERTNSSEPPSSAIHSKTTLVSAGKEFKDSPVWSRSELLNGHVVHGPCVVSEMDSNTVILPGFEGEVDAVGNILIRQVEEAAANTGSTKGDELDSATVDIFESALRNARNEMDTLLTHATMSPAIREQQDEFNVIAEPEGKMIVGQFGSFIGQFLEVWKGTIEPDDIFLTNDPYSVGGAVSHLNDWIVLMPIFVDGKLSKFVQSETISISTNCNVIKSHGRRTLVT